jgi:hypothetical protein
MTPPSALLGPSEYRHDNDGRSNYYRGNLHPNWHGIPNLFMPRPVRFLKHENPAPPGLHLFDSPAFPNGRWHHALFPPTILLLNFS